MKGRVLAISTIKGGTGKTTTAAALVQAAVYTGRRALAVDLDPQGNLTDTLGADGSRRGAYALLHGLYGSEAPRVVQQTAQGIDVISANPDLAGEKTAAGSGRRLAEALGPIRSKYDLIVIDTPPSIGELVYNALTAADTVLIPVETNSWALQAINDVTDLVTLMKRANSELTVAGCVITRFDGRTALNRQLRALIETEGEGMGAPLLGVIRRATAIAEAQVLRKSLYEYAPRSYPAQDYLSLLDQLIKKRKKGAKA